MDSAVRPAEPVAPMEWPVEAFAEQAGVLPQQDDVAGELIAAADEAAAAQPDPPAVRRDEVQEAAVPPPTLQERGDVLQEMDAARVRESAETLGKAGKAAMQGRSIDGLEAGLNPNQISAAVLAGQADAAAVDAAANNGFVSGDADAGVVPDGDSVYTDESRMRDEAVRKHIYMEELSENAGETVHTEERSETVQQVQQAHSGDGNLYGVPGSDTDGSGNRETPLQGVRGEEVTPSEALADKIGKRLADGSAFNAGWLFEQADKAFGGTMAAGTYTPKDAYDAMELAVNRYLMADSGVLAANGDAAGAMAMIDRLDSLLKLLPTQTERTEEMEQYQQFSTPPTIAYLAAWSAAITSADTVLEPSAGIGGLALWGKAWGATVYGNELSQRRAQLLRRLGLDGVYTENAEQIDNVLPESIKPTVVAMNPPFSSTAGRTASNKASNACRHIEQALLRLEDGGRLVAVLGKMYFSETRFCNTPKLILLQCLLDTVQVCFYPQGNVRLQVAVKELIIE